MSSSSLEGTKALCGVCGQRCPIYTCPRCAIRTCSLPCSKSHKALQSCSGERDKTAYVPMNKYGWGTMVNDYVYLEEVGRKAIEWGLDIAKGGFLTGTAGAGGRRRGQGRGSKTAPRGSSRGKRDILKMQLDARDLDMEMLPPGMAKRRLNQSTWDVRTKSALMTIEFVFHRRKDALASRSSPSPTPFILLTHRNNLDFTIIDILRRHVHERGKKGMLSPWVQSLASSLEDEGSTPPVCLIVQESGSPSHLISKTYHRLDSTQSLLTSLRNKTFVEYPTIEVWEDGDFTGALVEADGTFVDGDEELPPAKRRRVDATGGRKVIKSLLGGYRSEEEERGEEDNALDTLGNYGSDEGLQSANDAESAAATSGSEEDLDFEVDGVESRLEDMQGISEAVGPDPSLTVDHLHRLEEENGEEIDWSDSADEEGLNKL